MSITSRIPRAPSSALPRPRHPSSLSSLGWDGTVSVGISVGHSTARVAVADGNGEVSEARVITSLSLWEEADPLSYSWLPLGPSFPSSSSSSTWAGGGSSCARGDASVYARLAKALEASDFDQGGQMASKDLKDGSSSSAIAGRDASLWRAVLVVPQTATRVERDAACKAAQEGGFTIVRRLVADTNALIMSHRQAEAEEEAKAEAGCLRSEGPQSPLCHSPSLSNANDNPPPLPLYAVCHVGGGSVSIRIVEDDGGVWETQASEQWEVRDGRGIVAVDQGISFPLLPASSAPMSLDDLLVQHVVATCINANSQAHNAAPMVCADVMQFSEFLQTLDGAVGDVGDVGGGGGGGGGGGESPTGDRNTDGDACKATPPYTAQREAHLDGYRRLYAAARRARHALLHSPLADQVVADSVLLTVNEDIILPTTDCKQASASRRVPAFSVPITANVLEAASSPFIAFVTDMCRRCAAKVQASKAHAQPSLPAPLNIRSVVLSGATLENFPALAASIYKVFGKEEKGKRVASASSSSCNATVPPTMMVPHLLAPSSAAAIGAALLSRMASRVVSPPLVDVVALDVGVAVHGGFFHSLVPRNTMIPFSSARRSDCCVGGVSDPLIAAASTTVEKGGGCYPWKNVFTTIEDSQTQAIVTVVRGQRLMADANELIGRIVLAGIPQGLPRGAVDIIVTWVVDADGLWTITAEASSSTARDDDGGGLHAPCDDGEEEKDSDSSSCHQRLATTTIKRRVHATGSLTFPESFGGLSLASLEKHLADAYDKWDEDVARASAAEKVLLQRERNDKL